MSPYKSGASSYQHVEKNAKTPSGGDGERKDIKRAKERGGKRIKKRKGGNGEAGGGKQEFLGSF